MSKPKLGALILFVAIAIAAALALRGIIRHGFSARDTPSAPEAFVARRMRRWATPESARRMKNPFADSAEAVAAGRMHFADHCASCHGNDGRGKTEIGQNLYPKAPDIWDQQTQSLSDGEIFSIIKNGVRLTGMPAWGQDTPEDDRSTDVVVGTPVMVESKKDKDQLVAAEVQIGTGPHMDGSKH